MTLDKTHYEILGVPRTATAEQIKRRYRQLVRQYHPDVAQDKAAAKAAFIRISEAYQILSNPDKRVIYDASLDAEMFLVPPRIHAAQPSRPSTPGHARRTTHARTPGERFSQAQRWVHDARMAFIRGQFHSAMSACREAQRLDPRNIDAHVILGDIYTVQNRVDDAIAMYSIVVQLDPGNAEIQRKLDRLLRRRGAGLPVSAERQAALRMGLNLMGVSMSVFLFIVLAMSPGQPIVWIQQHLPMVGVWSTALLAILAITGTMTGFLLSVNETVGALDDELVFQAVRAPGRAASYPVGLIVLIFNVFSFYLAAGIYVLIGLVQESLSRSMMKAFVATFALAVIGSMAYGPDPVHTLIFGGNVVFPALLFGWAIGDMFRPAW